MLLLLAPLAGGEALSGQWRYERLAVATGQWWRLVTAHLVHLDVRHALLNCAGVVLLWALFARSYPPGRWLLVVLISLITVDAGLWFLSTGLSWYVGASAVLHGVFAAGCIAMIRSGDRIGLLAGLVFAGKLVWEQMQGPLPFDAGMPVVTVSHLYGALGGALAALVLRGPVKPLY